MRRKENEITDINELEDIIREAKVCRLAMAVNGTPYVVPLNFGYEKGNLYFHCAHEGRKIDMLKQNNLVCFEMDLNIELVENKDRPCNWGTTYQSVIGYGMAEFITNPADKKEALDIIMRHYSEETEFNYPPKSVENTALFKVVITAISGKKAH